MRAEQTVAKALGLETKVVVNATGAGGRRGATYVTPGVRRAASAGARGSKNTAETDAVKEAAEMWHKGTYLNGRENMFQHFYEHVTKEGGAEIRRGCPDVVKFTKDARKLMLSYPKGKLIEPIMPGHIKYYEISINGLASEIRSKW